MADKWTSKGPLETLILAYDWIDDLDDGDTIIQSDVTADAASGLEILSQNLVGTKCSIKVKGGRLGAMAELNFYIKCASGEEMTQSVPLAIRARRLQP
jgi:hypothetical protein